jgi:outer membrane protein assembly factor BamB
VRLRTAVSLFLLTFPGLGAEWPRFRGPNGSGVDSSGSLPVRFGTREGVAWKTGVPFGKSSPIVAGGRVFLTAAEGDKLVTLCLDARSGKLLWRREAVRARAQKLFPANEPASPTAAADDRNVYSFFPDLGLISYTFAGEERWRLPLGPFKNFYGIASSPVIVGGMVVLSCDQQTGSFLLAADKETGRVRWKAERPDMNIGWSVPIVYTPPQGPAQIVLQGSSRLDSYAAATGERLWWFPVSSEGSMGSPVADNGTLIVYSSGHDQPWMPAFASALAQYDKNQDGRISEEEFKGDEWFPHFGWIDANRDGLLEEAEWNQARSLGTGDYGILAIRPGLSKGRLPAEAVRWRFKRNLPYVPAPVLYKGVYFMVRTGGIVTSLNPETGALFKQGRSNDAPGEYYASPVAADGKVFLLSEAGKLTVLKAAPEWEVLAVNDLEEEAYATPAISDGRIYVRTRSAVYCFGR